MDDFETSGCDRGKCGRQGPRAEKESDYNVEDGENFRLEIRFTDGTGIVASGDNAFPDNYSDAMEAMWRILTWNAGDGSEQ